MALRATPDLVSAKGSVVGGGGGGNLVEDAGARAAKALAELVRTSGADEHMRDVYGPGAFYVMFETAKDAARFAEQPQLDDSVLFNDRDRCTLLGDLALGAVYSGHSYPVVVVDVYADQTRTTFRAGAAAPTCEHTEIVRVELAVESLPRPLDSARCALIERRVLDHLGGLRPPTTPQSSPCETPDSPPSASAVVRGGAQRQLVFVDDMRGEGDGSAAEIVSVEESAFDEFIESLSSSVDAPARSFRTIVTVWREHDARTHVVVWVRGADQVDSIWLIERPTQRSVRDASCQRAADDGSEPGREAASPEHETGDVAKCGE